MSDELDEAAMLAPGKQCLVCGGRGGWWSGAFREPCGHCDGSGWESSEIIRRILRDALRDCRG